MIFCEHVDNVYKADISQYEVLEHSDVIRLIKKTKKGCQKSKNILIQSNLKLVLKCVHKKYNSSLSAKDLVSEGNLGLIRAIEKFDISKDCKFSTYAIIWIKSAIQSYIYNHVNTVRLPAAKFAYLTKLRKARNLLENQTYSERISDSSLAESTNLSTSKIRYIKKYLDTSYNDSFNDIKSTYDIEDIMFEDQKLNYTSTVIKKIKKILSSKEYDIIARVYGLGKFKCLSLIEVSKHFNIKPRSLASKKREILKKIFENIGAENEDLFTEFFC